MAAVASESEQVVDQANEGVLAEQKPVDEKISEEEPKEEGAFNDLRIFVGKFLIFLYFPVCVKKCKWTRGLGQNFFSSRYFLKFPRILLLFALKGVSPHAKVNEKSKILLIKQDFVQFSR